MIIAPQLIPATSWGKNVRRVVSHQTWEHLRWYFYASHFKPSFTSSSKVKLTRTWKDPLVCFYCKAEKHVEDSKSNLHLHEVWKYDDNKCVQILVDFKPVCENCHLVFHFGRATQLGLKDLALNHLCKTNGISPQEAEKIVNKRVVDWQKRSEKQYKIAFSALSKLIPESCIHEKWLTFEKRETKDKFEIIEWARKLLSVDFVILDTETTGLTSYSKAEIIELAIIDKLGTVLYNSRFKPKYKITKRTIDIHGITNENVANCFAITQELDKIKHILDNKIILSYNSKFDREMLERAFRRGKVSFPEWKWDCIMQTYRFYCDSRTWLPLPCKSHSALDDAKAALNVIHEMAHTLCKIQHKPQS